MTLKTNIFEGTRNRNNQDSDSNATQKISYISVTDDLRRMCSKIKYIEEGKLSIENKDRILKVLHVKKT